MMQRSFCWVMATLAVIGAVATADHHPVSTVTLCVLSVYWLRAATGTSRVADDDLIECPLCESCGEGARVILGDGSRWCLSCHGSALSLGYDEDSGRTIGGH